MPQIGCSTTIRLPTESLRATTDPFSPSSRRSQTASRFSDSDDATETAEDDPLSALNSLGATPLDLIAYRHTSRNRPPLSGRGAQALGGRWNRRGGSAAIYLTDSVPGCAAEFRRMAAGQGRGSSALLPRALHHVHLDQMPLVDLAVPGALDALGLSRDDIRAADWSKCQLIGETAALAGYAGLRAPSATGIGHVIVLFEALIPEGRVHFIKTEDLSPYL
ncbi:RES family NAD+ phosphorylase [Candidatus Poriferisodalis sp.]|uniref:RES family NAD+ phosphorylase n=1 Tax=Candidatus Poriferisodalis sp. TaxID=3101277 RepID=UPI003B525950